MKKTNKGFTLVELIVVIGVLALLAIGAVIAFQNVQRNARISAANSDAARLADALNTYNSSVPRPSRITGSVPSLSAGDRVELVIEDEDRFLHNMDISVGFGTEERGNLIIGFVSWNDADGVFVVDRDLILSRLG